MSRAVIGMGSNMGDKLENLQCACDALELLPGTEVLRCSEVYETSPVGYAEQDSFYNAVALIKTTLSPNALLGALLGIEAAQGRVRVIKNGPRILDLDLLVYENCSCESEELVLPHPRIAERAFVTVPLLELFPDGNVLGQVYKQAQEPEGGYVCKIGRGIGVNVQ